MSKLGTPTRIHTHTIILDGKRGRCYGCGRRIIIKVPMLLKKLEWNGNLYCDSCHLQVSHGIDVGHVDTSKEGFKKLLCPVCKKRKRGKAKTGVWKGKPFLTCYECRFKDKERDEEYKKRIKYYKK